MNKKKENINKRQQTEEMIKIKLSMELHQNSGARRAQIWNSSGTISAV